MHGLADREIVQVWLGRDDPGARPAQDRALRLADGSTVTKEARDAVAYGAKPRVAVAVVSGSARAEIEPVLAQTGLMESIAAIVASDDIGRSKPDPEGYLIALDLLGVEASDAAAVEDSEAGVQAAKSVSLYCAAVTTTLPAERLSAADEIAHRFDRDLIAGLLSRS